MPILLQLQKYRGKGMEGENKMSLRRFLADQKIASTVEKNAFWGILNHEQQVIAYFQTHYD